MDIFLNLQNINKVFIDDKNTTEAIKDVSFSVNTGEIVGIVGTSGCGKSTLLNIIAGLTDKSGGTIFFKKDKPKIGYMLQNDSLLSWKNVLENACLGLELENTKNNENIQKVLTMLKKYGLDDFKNSKPSKLSGGMRQRVALIRSLAINPDILLLDEPFSALDYYTRIKISEDVKKIIKETKTTTILITHDIAEALSLSDKVIVLSNRPSVVKNIYKTDLPDKLDIIHLRSLHKFNQLYEYIWRDLNEET